MSDVLSELGYIGLALLMIAETVFPPIQSEVVLPLAGYLVFTGELEFVPALIASTVGSLVGAVLLEEAARYGGRPFAERFVRFAPHYARNARARRTLVPTPRCVDGAAPGDACLACAAWSRYPLGLSGCREPSTLC